MGKAIVVGYRWSKKRKLGFELGLVGDILQSICAEKRRYNNREVNRKKREAGIPIPRGRPKKETDRPGPRKSKAHSERAPSRPDRGRTRVSKKHSHRSRSIRYILFSLSETSLPNDLTPPSTSAEPYPQRTSAGPADSEVQVPRSEPASESDNESTDVETVRPIKRKVRINY